jgi:surface antigen
MRSKSSSISKLSGEFYDLAIDTNKIVEAIGQDFSGKLPSLLIGNLRHLGAKQKLLYETLNEYGKKITVAADKYEKVDKELAKTVEVVTLEATSIAAAWGLGGDIGKKIADVDNYKYGVIDDFNYGIRGECVWYVRNRAIEKNLGTYGIYGDAHEWFGKAQKYEKDNNASITGKEIRADSIACFGPNYQSSLGHVVFVEKVENGLVYFTEANVDSGIGDKKVGGNDGVLKCLTIEEFENLNKKWGGDPSLQGYIYL